MIDSIQKYWRIYLSILLVAGAGVFLVISSGNTRNLDAQEQALIVEIEALEKELARKTLTEEDMQPEVEVIEQAGVHAQDMGAEMIQAQKKLADAYRSAEPVATYEDKKGLEEAEQIFTRLTTSTDYVNTWFLNGTWDMRLDTIGTYTDSKDIPVVFSMYTAAGDLAGVVRAKYDNERDLLDDILVDYTVSGYADEIDVGGM